MKSFKPVLFSLLMILAVILVVQNMGLFNRYNVRSTILLNPKDFDNPPKVDIKKAKALRKRLGISENG